MFKQLIRILSWNIKGCKETIDGLKTNKLEVEEIINHFNKYDIICIQEMHEDRENVKNIHIPNFAPGIHYTRPKRKKSMSSSGGISVFIKEHLRQQVCILPRSNSDMVWIKMGGINNNDIFIGCVYIPPVTSSFGRDNSLKIWDSLEENIEELATRGDIILCGDFNARTARISDYIEMDDDDDDDHSDHLPNNYSFEDLHNRNSMDKLVQKSGRRLISICIDNNMYILNGRTLGDLDGRFTCYNHNGSSVVDYFICSKALKQDILSMTVHPLSQYSDHCPIELNIVASPFHKKTKKYCSPDNSSFKTSHENSGKKNEYKWDNLSEEKFKKAITMPWIQDQLLQIENQVNSYFQDNTTTSVDKVNEIVNEFTDIMSSVANISLSKKNKQNKRKKKKNKKWFDMDCYIQKKEIKSILNALNRQPYNQYIREKYFAKRKIYNRCIKEKKRKYKNILVNKLNDDLNKDPSTAWRTLKELQTMGERITHKHHISTSKWISHLENIIGKDIEVKEEQRKKIKDELDNIGQCYHVGSSVMDRIISDKEVKEACLHQKNKKSPGKDGITNEMIKTSLPKTMIIIKNIFNMIFSTGIYPDNWKNGINIPLYKNGNPLDVNNYRGITLTSTLGKIFSTIINTRINLYLDNENILIKEQAGFRKKYRTTDQIFIIKKIIDQALNVKNGRLYGCFVDFQKAFDNVWHDALLTKLFRTGIKGKCYNIIKDMYTNASICAKSEDRYSREVMIKKGVHQGSTLSPTLFNIFINDITQNLLDNDSPKIEAFSTYRIPCLLYADDLVVFSVSKKGLQRKLDHLNEYCNKWGMKINKTKTKVVVFSKVNPKVHISFRFGEDIIETAEEYKYLGVILHKRGHFIRAQDHLSKQANKALHTLRRTFRRTDINFDIISQLYDSLIMPISTYAAEIWFPHRLKGKKELDLNDLFKECLSNKFSHEMLHSKFCRQFLGVHKKAMVLPVLGELGRYPITLKIICQVISYWIHILERPKTSHLSMLYDHMYNVAHDNNPWISFVKQILHTLGLDHVWKNQFTFSGKRLKHVILQKLEGKYMQFWTEKVNSSSKLEFYRIVTKEYETASYLTNDIDFKYKQALCKLRISAHDLKIEKGRYDNTPKENRLCQRCGVIENELHMLDTCIEYKHFREQLMKQVNKSIPVYTMPSQLLLEDNLQFMLGKFVYNCFLKKT